MHPALGIRSLDGFQRKVFDALARSEAQVTQAEIAKRLGVDARSQATISRTLAALIARGLVAKTGETKGARFRLTPDARWFNLAAGQRTPVPYDPARIGGYQPNQTRWLAPELANQMRVAAGSPMALEPATYTKEIAERFLIEMSWASSALEGNTYSLLETEVLIKYAEKAVGRSVEEAQMILNHKDAIGFVVDRIDTLPFDVQTVQRLHALLMRGLVRQENLGGFRSHEVGISNSAYRPTTDRIELASATSEMIYKASQVDDPFESSFLMLVGSAYLQAFADGNKRLGRLLSSIPLLKAGYAPLSFVGVDKQEYHAGMISWYELGDPRWVAGAIVKGYEFSAPSYHVATLTKRTLRSVEIKERKRFDAAVTNFMKAFSEGDERSPSEYAGTVFAELEEADREILVESFAQAIGVMDEIKATAYGVPNDVVEAYLTRRDSPPTGPGSP